MRVQPLDIVVVWCARYTGDYRLSPAFMFSTQFNAIADHISPLGPARLNKRSDPCCEWFVILFFTLAVLWNSLKLSSQTMGIPSSFKSTFSTSFVELTRYWPHALRPASRTASVCSHWLASSQRSWSLLDVNGPIRNRKMTTCKRIKGQLAQCKENRLEPVNSCFAEVMVDRIFWDDSFEQDRSWDDSGTTISGI